jgi:hypothetical protein
MAHRRCYKEGVWSIFGGPRTAVLDEILGAPDAPVGVLGDPAIARRLREGGRQVVDALDGQGDLAGVILAAASPPEQIARATAATREGGVIVWLTRGSSAALAAEALCAGLTDVGQRSIGWTLITHGRVRRLAG